MRYGSIPGVGGSVSRLVLGSMVFSTEPKAFDNTRRLLDRFVAAGGTTVDTARIYSGGTSESAFGQWLHDAGRRQDMVVLGKGAHHNSQTLERRVTPAAIHEDIRTSLHEMQLDTIDIYVLHKDDPQAAVGPIVEALNEERARDGSRPLAAPAGRTRGLPKRMPTPPSTACCHFRSPARTSPWRYPTNRCGLAASPSPGMRRPRRGTSSRACRCLPGRPRRADSFLGFRPELKEGQTTEAKNVIRTYYSEANWERYRRADELAEFKGCTLRQVALAWVLHSPLEVFALIGPATVAELDDCLGALDVQLTPDEVAWLNLESSHTAGARAS